MRGACGNARGHAAAHFDAGRRSPRGRVADETAVRRVEEHLIVGDQPREMAVPRRNVDQCHERKRGLAAAGSTGEQHAAVADDDRGGMDVDAGRQDVSLRPAAP